MTLYATEPEKLRLAPAIALPDAPASPRWPWVWMAVACTLMASSGLVRVWQDRRFVAYQSQAILPTFPLKELPEQFGTWKAREGSEHALDPQVARIAGSSDSVIRTYVDKDTGVVLDVLVLHGRAELVSGHTPEVCYPSAGYEPSEEASSISVPLDRGEAIFRSLLYTRKGSALERVEVHYAFRQQGRWSPEVEGNWKALNVDPGLFKVQVQRRVGERERRDLGNPTEQFLSVMLPVLDKRIASAQEAGASKGRRGPQE
jgi:hypothetical protein